MIKLLNKLLITVMLFGTSIITIININNNDFSKIFSCLSIVIIFFIPLSLKKTRFYLTDKNKLILNIFIFFAQFLGKIINLYDLVWWYDIIVHYLSGIFSFILAIFILKRLNKYQTKNTLFNIIFIFGVIFLVAGIWEILEFLGDILFNLNLQNNIETGVRDTMEDIIVAFLGGLTILPFYLRKQTKKGRKK